MKIYRRLAIAIVSGQVLEADTFEYAGPVDLLKGGGGGGGTSSTAAQVPAEMKPLVSQSATNAMQYQNQFPMDPFFSPHPEQVAGLSENQQLGEAAMPYAMSDAFTDPTATGWTLANDPGIWAAQNEFEQTELPLIQNQMATMGLGRSSALPQATSMGEAKFLAPAINAALGREQQGREAQIQNEFEAIANAMKTGAVSQQTQQQAYEAAQQDFMRQQALAEEVNLGPIEDILPSTIGSSTVSSQKGGGK